MTLKKLNARLEKEYDELIQEGLDWSIENDENEHVYFINHANEFALYKEVKKFFVDMDEEDYERLLKKRIEQIKPSTKILRGIYNSWFDYEYPYNFFDMEDLWTIVRDWLNRE